VGPRERLVAGLGENRPPFIRWQSGGRRIRARAEDFEKRLAALARERGGLPLFVYELLWFGCKQAYACLFGGAILALLIATHFWYPHGAAIARYDFLVIAAVVIQVLMPVLRLETKAEARVILIFHVVGTAMEVFKTAVGSWVYPEASVLRLAGVPLFTGFMYGAIGSYIARCWRLFDFRFTGHPSVAALSALSVAIYANFFLHHFGPDFRILLFAAACYLLGPATVHFRIDREHRRMPLLLGLALVALFIWIAENIGTFTAAWVYPSQGAAWHAVSLSKMGAWLLLMLISYTMVAAVNGCPPMRR
jgi:uncharacterized membrane protein YoaT (DUF817 family)